MSPAKLPASQGLSALQSALSGQGSELPVFDLAKQPGKPMAASQAVPLLAMKLAAERGRCVNINASKWHKLQACMAADCAACRPQIDELRHAAETMCFRASCRASAQDQG